MAKGDWILLHVPNKGIALTAAHCVPAELSFLVSFPQLSETSKVLRVVRHPTADIAMLFTSRLDTPSDSAYRVYAFWDGVGTHGLGEEFLAYGFPAVGEPSNPQTVAEQGPAVHPPRLYRRHFQRFLRYTSPSGHDYAAAELSIPAPGGLSGSPMIR